MPELKKWFNIFRKTDEPIFYSKAHGTSPYSKLSALKNMRYKRYNPSIVQLNAKTLCPVDGESIHKPKNEYPYFFITTQK